MAVAVLGAALAAAGPLRADYTIAAAGEQVRFTISAAHGNLAGARAQASRVLGRCEDEYWVEGEDGAVSARATEADDKVTRTRHQGKTLVLECRNEKLDLTVTKTYAPGPLPGSLRKTVSVRAPKGGGLVHVFSRSRLASSYARDAYLYTPRQSWGGKQLLFGVRRLGDLSGPVRSSCGWDNRFVVAFHQPRQWAVAHWRSLVDGVWVPCSGIIAPWGKTSPFALTYLPDGWRFRLLHCAAGETASAAADYVLLRGDWYDAWAGYKKLPGFRAAYRSLDTMPRWCRQVKYGTFWQP
ncbi:MAG: hypothetical protein J7M26_10615, partial [Armatimonadetes bacterium]|nr:hypothetical protein [Armatimonadota bacterium]